MQKKYWYDICNKTVSLGSGRLGLVLISSNIRKISSMTMNNTTKPGRIVRRSVSEARAAQAARDLQKEIDEVKEDLKDRKVKEGEQLRRVMLEDSRDKGARRGAGDFYSGLGGFDTSLIVRGRR